MPTRGTSLSRMHRPSHSVRRRAVPLAVLASVLFVLPLTTVAATATPAGPVRPVRVAQDGGTQDDGDNPQLSGEYNDVLRKEAQLQKELDAATKEAHAATEKLAALQTKTRNTQISLLAAQDAFRKATLAAKLRAEAQAQAERRADRALERLRKQAVASFVRGGDSSLLEAVLSAKNGKEAGQALAFGNATIGNTETLLRTLRHARAVERREAKAAAAARKRASAKRKEIELTTQVLVVARDRQKTLVAQVDLKLEDVNKTLLEVQTRKLLVQGELDGGGGSGGGVGAMLAALQADEPDYQLGSVDISAPIPGAKPSSPFGIRFHPILHIYRLHAGCDIGAPTGTTIYAPADGTVVLAAVTGGYGNTTVIDHGNSLATLYGHQSQILVHVGQVVKKGDVIGKVGSTGLSTGPHLHFETRIKGTPVDPEGIVDFDAQVGPPGDPYNLLPEHATTTTTTPN